MLLLGQQFAALKVVTLDLPTSPSEVLDTVLGALYMELQEICLVNTLSFLALVVWE